MCGSLRVAGFSRQTVQLLTEQGVKFNTFDILTDNDVRQGTVKPHLTVTLLFPYKV